jgi:hypothetical protein
LLFGGLLATLACQDGCRSLNLHFLLYFFFSLFFLFLYFLFLFLLDGESGFGFSRDGLFYLLQNLLGDTFKFSARLLYLRRVSR